MVTQLKVRVKKILYKPFNQKKKKNFFPGGYTFKEADGTTRIVEYTADHKNGFNAVVKIEGHEHEHESHSSGSESHDSHGHSHYSY